MFNTDKIRALNDAARRALQNVVVTSSVHALEPGTKASLLAEVRSFAAFNEGDDPYNEHDFGALTLDGTRYFWKIDYYDPTLEFGSDNPADPTITRRVITVMRADEY